MEWLNNIGDLFNSLFTSDATILINVMDSMAKFVYNLFACNFFLTMLDLCQKVFYAFAGIGNSVTLGGTNITISNGGDKYNENGIEYYLLTSDMVRNIWYSMLILACVLLLLFTIIAFLKNIYTDKPKSWQTIIGDAIKGIGMFVFVPVVCLFGVYLGNGLLRAVNQFSTARGVGTLNYKYLVIRTAYYNANTIRNGSRLQDIDNDDIMEVPQDVIDDLKAYATMTFGSNNDNSEAVNNGSIKLDDIDSHDREDIEYFADILDKIQAHRSSKIDEKYVLPSCTVLDKVQWYNIDSNNFSVIEFFIIVGGLIFSVGGLAMGMIKRLFMILVLFIISPIVCALYPLQGNNPVKTWTGDFVKNVTSAYSGVFGLNLMFILMPYITNMDFGLKQGYANLVSIFIVIAATSVVKDIINLISGYIGAGNAYGEGNGMFNDSYNRVKGGLAKTGQFASAGAGTIGNLVGTGFSVFEAANLGIQSKMPENKKSEGAMKALSRKQFGNALKGAGKTVGSATKFTTLQGVADMNMSNVPVALTSGYKDVTGETPVEQIGKAIAYKEYEEIENKKDEAKKADNEVNKLTNDNNKTLNKLAESKPEGMTEEDYKKDLVERAEKGIKWEMEDFAKVDKSTSEGRKQYARMLEENKYISTVSSAVEKRDEAQKFLDDVKSYKEAGYGLTEALALKNYRAGKQPKHKVEEKSEAKRENVYADAANETPTTTANVPTGEKPIVVTPGATEERPYKRQQPESNITADNVKLTVSSADFNAQNSQQTLYTVQQQTQNSTVEARKSEVTTNLLNQQNDDKNAQLIINAIKQMTEYEKKMNDYLAQLTQKLDELNGTMVDGLKGISSKGGDGSDSSTGGSGTGGSPTRFNGGNKGDK